MAIEQARSDSFPQLLALQLDCISKLTSTYAECEIAAWIAYLEEAGSKRFGDFTNYIWRNEQGEITAFISWSLQPESVVSIECLYVTSAMQNNGIGATLLNKAQKAAQPMPLTVRSTLNALEFYERQGFVFQEYTTSRAGFRIAVLNKPTS